MSIALTVLITTRNGGSVLPRTLDAYCRVDKPSHAWKMVIVDNGSTDATPEILASFRNRLPLETFQFPIAGQNRARNFGLNFIEGRMVVFTDDDAVPDPSFLAAWSEYLDRGLEYEILGGSIDLLFESPPPKWVLKNKAHFALQFAFRDLPEGPVAAHEVFSPNMVVRASLLKKAFRFAENIGPSDDPNYPMGSETEFCRRAERSGARAWFAKEPRVRHIIRSSLLSRSSWTKRFYRHGRGFARQTWEAGQAPPRYIFRPFMIDQAWRLYHRLRMLSPSSVQSIQSMQSYYWKQGFADEWKTQRAAAVTRSRVKDLSNGHSCSRKESDRLSGRKKKL
jgi:glycosyltransferase involved in cell wall biosynthesis